MLTLTNSLTKEKGLFTPLSAGRVKLYVCGITPYDDAHLGHGRCYVTFDLLLRVLRLLGYEVDYVRNFTDIDDKIINKAAAEGCSYTDVAQRYIDRYHADMQRLDCLPPTVEPRVTTHISEIIAFIEGLIAKGHAYVVNGDVYFAIETFAQYGKLSGRTIEDMVAGARVSINEEKRNPGDFALWKACEPGQYWQSPWGFGRPGWHIECSAMALKHLGQTIDIHAGGMDLMFPHHENEIAQSESLTGQSMAQVWLHNAFININKEKMSKSLGNTLTLRDAFERYHPMVLRFYYLQHHYRSPLDFELDGLASSAAAYKRLLSLAEASGVDRVGFMHLADQQPILKEMLEALCDDLNSVKMLGILFEHFAAIKQSKDLASGAKFILQSVLGLNLESIQAEQELSQEVRDLLTEREQARKAKDWARADQIRALLAARGIAVQDEKTK